MSQFRKGERVQIRVWIPGKGFAVFEGIVTEERPLRARVTDDDPIWFGAEFTGRAILKRKT